MKLFLLIFFLSATDNCSGCSSTVSSVTRTPSLNAIPPGTTHPSDLIFTAGDIISCDVESLYAFSDIMLATSKSTVIHIEGSGPYETRILEDNFLTAADGFKRCKVITKFYDEKYASDCRGTPFNNEEILRRADLSRVSFRGRTTYYDRFKCNPEHWVSSWRYGSAWTLQLPKLFSSIYKSDNCEAPGKQSCF